MINNIKKLAEQINQEVQELTKAREGLIEIKKKMVEAGFSEDQACKKLATAIGGLDFRTIKKWLRQAKLLVEPNPLMPFLLGTA